jgi:lyso-ornithine lipid O-acyltransferase
MMQQDAAASVQSISVIGHGRIVLKIAAMLIFLLAILPMIYFCRTFCATNPWPRRFMKAVICISGVELHVTGQRVRGNEFLVANHVSWIDIAAISAASGASFIANDGLGAHPFTRWMCEMNGAILVARHDRASVQDQINHIRVAVKERGTLAIFPEGTTSDGSGLLPFKSSLLSALDPLPDGVAVQPVLLDYGPQVANLAWIGVEPGQHNFKRLMAQRTPARLNVHFLPPLAGDDLANRKSIANAARMAILQELEFRQSQRVAL